MGDSPGAWRASHVVLVVKNPPANAGDIRETGSVPGLGRSPGGIRGKSLQYFASRATVQGVAKSQTGLKRFSSSQKPLKPKY